MPEHTVSTQEQTQQSPNEVASRQRTSPEQPRNSLDQSPQESHYHPETTQVEAPESRSRIPTKALAEPRHNGKKGNASTELDQAEVEASDDRCPTDPCPHDSPQPSGEQATVPDSAQTYSEEARKALIQCYDLLLQLARQDDTPDDQPLNTGAGSNYAPDAFRSDSDTERQDVESGAKEAVNG